VSMPSQPPRRWARKSARSAVRIVDVESVALDGKTLLDSVLRRLRDGRAHDVAVRMRSAGDTSA
jgi:hypothetical protein